MTNDVTDNLETMLLLLMDGKHGTIKCDDGTHMDMSKRGNAKKMNEFVDYDITERVRCDDMTPNSIFTADMTESRLLAITPDYLMAHPADIIGDELEAALFCDDVIKWQGYRKCKAPPRRVAALGRIAAWYEHHYRVIRPDGTGTYQKRFVPLSRSGHAVIAKMDGLIMCNPAEATLNMCGVCSIAEDSARTNTMLASIADAVEVKFPVPLDAYKDVFALRDAPMTPSGRRRAIVHWVAGHIRRSTNGNDHKVARHTRGVEEFTIDGLRVRLLAQS